MPSEEVQESGQWLTNQAKADPEDHISSYFALYPLGLLDNIGEYNERNLHHHSNEGHADDVVCRNTNK